MALVQQCIRLNFLPVEMSNWHQGTTKNKSIELRLNLIYFILKCGPLKTSEGVQTEYSTTTEYGAFFEGKINTGWFRSAPGV